MAHLVPTRRALLRPGDSAWLEELGDAARLIGGDAFPAALMRLFGRLIRHDMAMVVRYGKFAAPDFLVCDRVPQGLLENYRSGWYRFDPFYDHWRKRERGGVVSLREVATASLVRSRYRRVFQRQSKICDELGMFLPGVGRAGLALFLERSKGWFTTAEKERARRVYPAVAGLYRAHVSRIFAALGSEGGSGSIARATLLLDREGSRVFANKPWREAEADAGVRQAMAALADLASGQVALGGNRVLHVEPLERDFPPAPGGRIFVVEQMGLTPATWSPQTVIARFGAALTPRERDIVSLILEGHPNATIARRLAISRGTVKNHRRRLYDKLDITSERELFLLYLDRMSQAEATR